MNAVSTLRTITNTEAKMKYRELCRKEPGLPLFDQDWWLDVTCGGADHWDAVLVEQDGCIVASMPYRVTKKSMFEIVSMPQLTLTMGVWIRYPEGMGAGAKLAYEREIYSALIDGLPQVDYFSQQLHWDNTNWSIFYWRGFRQTTRFTYVLEDLSDLERVYAGFTDSVRDEIRRAEQQVKIAWSDDLARFQEMNSRLFDPPRFPMPYSFEVLKALDERCKRRNRRKILFAEDADGEAHCAMYLVWDDRYAYYLLGGETPRAKESGAHSLLVWHAIREMAKFGKRFDFHGGMHEPHEIMYRSFGATQKPYFQISKINGKLFKFAYYLKQAIR
ncbi:GNAT family N-acetyltransferase [Cohnella sp. CFH 77786]|uniref:GNAT family N-acetyltransferase n=1 Tax=Cohnella sp. CFH 77786 TaxID=2662265 RepID=UPI001C60CC39|nr:GNAT family N-acetyltransferase [Cohnella sp. CFH 77786]MBW5448361.1 GNAT family N-acetyltransferase [Cohnella sp. CFH 77786]